MLRHKPKLTYIGLTVILSNPSRFDKASLLSANGGHLFNDYCLRPSNNILQCDVRELGDLTPLLPDTKCIVILGEAGMHKLLPETRNNNLGEVRGSVYYYNGIPCIPTFFPQDACDFRNLEEQLNPLNANYSPDADEEREEEDDAESAKSHGKTSRKNYAFWIRADIAKCKTIIREGGKVPASEFPSPNYVTYPSSTVICNILEKTKGQVLFFDIETDYEEQNIQCFSFTFNGITIYNIPVLTYSYQWAYDNLHNIMRSLAIAIRDNILVAHNGANFDFFVLAYKYKIPVNKVYDTMIAMHRCFPDIEKSLGHCVSYWTWERFHKDEDSHGYMNQAQMQARMAYCGKDVYTMFLVYNAIQKYAKTIPGLTESIETAMAAIKPYLITSLQGIRFSVEKIKEAAFECDRLMEQYDRMIRLLIGESSLKVIHSLIKGKAKMFAGSNTQCSIYFHEMLYYPILFRSAKTQKPSLGKKVMYKLALKHSDNPVIQLVLAFRTIQKEYGTYKFIPWLLDDKTHGKHSVLEVEEPTFL